MQNNNVPSTQGTKNIFNNGVASQVPASNISNGTKNNIFARNVITSPITNSSNNDSQSNIKNIFSNKPIVLTPNPNTNTFATNNQAGNSLASGIRFNQPQQQFSSPFNKSNNIISNQCTSDNVFTRPPQNNAFANIIPTNHEHNKTNISNIFNNNNYNPTNSQIFNNRPQGSTENQKPLGAIFNNSQQTNTIFQNNQQSQNSVQFQPLSNNTFNNNGGKNQMPANSNATNVFKQDGDEGQRQNTIPSVHEIQLINLINRMQIGQAQQLNKIISPFNYYHAKLILHSLINKIQSANLQTPDAITEKQLQVKIKDCQYQNEVIIMIQQMSATSTQLNNMHKNMSQLQARADKMQSKLKQQMLVKRQRLIGMIRWQKMSKNIMQELDRMQGYLSRAVRPLLMALQANKKIQFEEPDTFILQIAQWLHSKMNSIQTTMNEFITQLQSSYSQITHHHHQNKVQAANIIHQLIQYFQALCVKFQELKQYFQWQLHKQSKQFISIIQNKMKQIKQKQVCKVKYFINAISKTLEPKPSTIHRKLKQKMQEEDRQ